MRSQVGYPYIFFTDTVNKNKPSCFQDKTIYASNMCTEIALPSNEDETFVCVLSSMNLVKYDEWRNTDAVETLTIFLDTVVSEFIEKTLKMKETNLKAFNAISKAYEFSKNWRALGLGVLGWHSYLQSKMIPFESREAAKLNVEIHRLINTRAYKASEWMGKEWGIPENLLTSGRRNATLLAIAPTKSSSFILGGVSQGIEPEMSNFYIKDLAKIKTTVKNPYLQNLLSRRFCSAFRFFV
jgi:ribonucleoside-diphosphate reductase alpha chain